MLEVTVLFPTARQQFNHARFKKLFTSAKHKNKNNYKSQAYEFAMKSLRIITPLSEPQPREYSKRFEIFGS
jgi:hypothetical protein